MRKSNCPVVMITGAAGGIGQAAALKFYNNKYRLVLVDIDEGKLDAMATGLGIAAEDLLLINGDLQCLDLLEAMVSQSLEKFGRIDVLINNAAWRTTETMRHISVSDWEKTIRINLTAPAFLAKYAAESMEKNKIKGVIINISSVMSKRTGGYSPAYSVCKGGIESLTYELAVLYGPSGIRSVGVSPGNVVTEMSTDYKNEDGVNISQELAEDMDNHTPLGRAALTREIGDAVFWLSSPEASFITGTMIEIDGGFSKNFNSYKIKNRLNPSEF